MCVCICVLECCCRWGTGLAALPNPLRFELVQRDGGGSVADIKVNGESCLLMLLLGEPSGN